MLPQITGMARESVWRLLACGVVLLVATALINVGNAVAEGDQQTQPALAETQVVTNIPSENGEPFSLEWGGGSLYHLKGRLATMGCLVNTIMLYDGGEWWAYNQYEVPSTLTRDFVERYAEFIPSGTLYATCFHLCEFKYIGDRIRECETSAESISEGTKAELWPVPIDDTAPCTRDFSPKIVAGVLPILPIVADRTCIIRQPAPRHRGISGNGFLRFHSGTVPIAWWFIVIYTPDDWITSSATEAEREQWLASVDYIETHELCHANQGWHIASGLQPDRVLREHPNDIWYSSRAGTEFIALTEFSKNEDGEWGLPEGSVYEEIYNINPKELSAELCTFYLTTNDAGLAVAFDLFVNDPPLTLPLEQYLTPEVVQWIETYVVLPKITGNTPLAQGASPPRGTASD